MATSKPIRIERFLGLNNVVEPERAPAGAMSSAVNVEIMDDRAIRSRAGLTSISVSAAHSAWGDGAGNAYFVTAGGSLVRYTKAGALDILFDGLAPGAHVYFAEAAGAVYLSDGINRLRVRGSSVERWGVEAPVPLVVAVGGSLAQGRYLAAVAFVSEDGTESGASGLLSMEVAASGGGFEFSIAEWPDDAGVAAAHVYMTACNGETLVLAGEFARGGTLEIVSESFGTRPLATFGMTPPALPTGPMVEHFGRLYIPVGQFVQATRPMNYDLSDPLDFLPLDSPVTMIASVPAGLVVGTESSITLFRGSSMGEMTAEALASYGAPKQAQGQQVRIEATDSAAEAPAVAFFTHRGACIVTSAGQLLNLTDKSYRFADALEASCAVRVNPDARQMLLLLRR